MQAQKNNLDDLFKDALVDYESAPVKLSWNQVANQLDERAAVKKKVRYYQLAAAAVVLIAFSFSIYMYIQPAANTLAGTSIQAPQKLAAPKQESVIAAAAPALIKIQSSKSTATKKLSPRKAAPVIKKVEELPEKTMQEPIVHEESPLFATTVVVPESTEEVGLKNHITAPVIVNTSELPISKRKVITTTSIINNLVAKLDKRKDPFLKIEQRNYGNDETAMNYSVNLGFIKLKRTVN